MGWGQDRGVPWPQPSVVGWLVGREGAHAPSPSLTACSALTQEVTETKIHPWDSTQMKHVPRGGWLPVRGVRSVSASRAVNGGPRTPALGPRGRTRVAERLESGPGPGCRPGSRSRHADSEPPFRQGLGLHPALSGQAACGQSRVCGVRTAPLCTPAGATPGPLPALADPLLRGSDKS